MKIGRILVLLLVLMVLTTFIPVGGMVQAIGGTVTVDGAVSTNTASSGSSITISHTTGTGTNRLTLVGVSWNSNTSAVTISSVTFTPSGGNATGLSQVISQKHGSNNRYAAIYSLLDPPSGAAGTVMVNFSASVSSGIVAGAINFAGVDQSTPLGTAGGASSPSNNTTPTVTLDSLNGDELVFDTVFIGGNPPATLTVGADQTVQWNPDYAGNTRGAASTEQAAGSSVTMSWTAASSSMWVIAAVPINPALAGPTFDLTMAADPVAGGTTEPSVGVHTYPENTVVEISATATDGYHFVNWTGEVDDPDSSSANVTVDANKTVTANFALDEYTLNISTSGDGSVTRDPDQATYHYGDSVILTPVPDSGWVFTYWSGDLAGSDNPGTIVIDGNNNVTAHFSQPSPLGLDGTVSSGAADDVSNIDVSHTIGTGTDRLMLVGVSWNCGSTDRTISSVTFTPSGGSATALDPVIMQPAGTQLRYVAIYSLLNPPAGVTGTVTVNFSGSVGNGIVVGVTNFAGVDQTTPLGTPEGAPASSTSSDSPGVTLTGLNGNEIVFDTVFQGASNEDQTLTAGEDQTRQWHEFTGNTRAAGSTEQATGSEVTMSWTAASASYWAIAAVPVNPAAEDVTYTLTTAVDGNGTIGLDPIGGTYDAGTEVELTASADPGWTFDHWSVDLSGSDNPATITMDDNYSVTAVFTQDEYSLTADTIGNGTVERDVNGPYHYGDVVQLTASADPGWTFDQWSGDLSGQDNPATMTIYDNYTVTAIFTQNEYSLTVDTIGNGTVGRDNNGPYHYGDSVQLTAEPDTDWSFDQWSGDLSSSDNPATIIMDGDKNVTATFTNEPVTYTLTVIKIGNGGIIQDPYHVSYNPGNVVQLTATADEGWSFDGWSGDLESTDNPASITMDGDKVVTATFIQDMYTLTIGTAGNGSVLLDPDDGSYLSGTSVQLTAVADSGYVFAGWSDDLTGLDNPATIIMDGDKDVTANFVIDAFAMRELPAAVAGDTTFQVVIRFTAPDDNFNSIGVSDVAPAGWVVTADKTWCAPAATENNTPAINKAEYVWFASYTAGTEFTVVYNVTVPAGTAPGVYSFPGGQVEYYIGGDGPFTVPIGGDSEVSWGSVISGVVAGADGTLLPGATVEIYLDDVLQDTATSDIDGQYELVATETGEYTVVASAPGFKDETQTISVPSMDTGYTLDFIGNHGLIPEAPDMSYVLACANKWLYPPAEHPEMALSMSKVLAVANAWLYPDL